MEINFSKLSVYDVNKGAFDEYNNYWDLPVTYPILHGNPERPIEDWQHHWGKAHLYFVFTDTKPQANASIEFIDPSGASRGKRTMTLHANQGYGCDYTEFDKLGTWKIKGTLNGLVKTWDALIIVKVEEPIPPPPPPPQAIQNILCWNPYTKVFQSELLNVPPDTDIGVKFTLENVLQYTNTFRAVVRHKSPAGGSQLFTGDDVALNPGGKHAFECMKVGGWTAEGSATADIFVYRVVGGSVGSPEWTYYGALVANISSAAPPVEPPPPPPGEGLNLKITSYHVV